MDELRQEARSLTLSLYRCCMRSVEVIRHGNDNDEKDFREREKKRLDGFENTDSRLSMLTLLPPVDRKDELRSRAEYYQQYARENFVQDGDSLSADVWENDHIQRFLYHLRQGEKHRKWLLKDMKFEDPYANVFDKERVMMFEKDAKEMLSASDQRTPVVAKDDGFWTDEDED